MSTFDSNIVGAADVVAHFPDLLRIVEGGQEITITKDGNAIARLVPVKRDSTREDREEAIRRWQEQRKAIGPLGANVKDLISEGRP